MNLLLIITTCFYSLMAFQDSNLLPDNMRRPEYFNKLKFNAYLVTHKKQYYRLFTHGLIHADVMHLAFNMLTLYCFGDFVIDCFSKITVPNAGAFIYLGFYISALAVSSTLDLARHQDNMYYNAIGASGAVSAVIFAAIIFNPMMKINFFFIPIGIPGWLFGILYLTYCIYMDKRNNDNIGHSAHFMGAVYGLLFPILLNHDVIFHFIKQFTY